MRVLSRRAHEFLCVVGERVEWIDVEDGDEAEICTCEETLDAKIKCK